LQQVQDKVPLLNAQKFTIAIDVLCIFLSSCNSSSLLYHSAFLPKVDYCFIFMPPFLELLISSDPLFCHVMALGKLLFHTCLHWQQYNLVLANWW